MVASTERREMSSDFSDSSYSRSDNLHKQSSLRDLSTGDRPRNGRQPVTFNEELNELHTVKPTFQLADSSDLWHSEDDCKQFKLEFSAGPQALLETSDGAFSAESIKALSDLYAASQRSSLPVDKSLRSAIVQLYFASPEIVGLERVAVQQNDNDAVGAKIKRMLEAMENVKCSDREFREESRKRHCQVISRADRSFASNAAMARAASIMLENAAEKISLKIKTNVSQSSQPTASSSTSPSALPGSLPKSEGGNNRLKLRKEASSSAFNINENMSKEEIPQGSMSSERKRVVSFNEDPNICPAPDSYDFSVEEYNGIWYTKEELGELRKAFLIAPTKLLDEKLISKNTCKALNDVFEASKEGGVLNEKKQSKLLKSYCEHTDIVGLEYIIMDQRTIQATRLKQILQAVKALECSIGGPLRQKAIRDASTKITKQARDFAVRMAMGQSAAAYVDKAAGGKLQKSKSSRKLGKSSSSRKLGKSSSSRKLVKSSSSRKLEKSSSSRKLDKEMSSGKLEKSSDKKLHKGTSSRKLDKVMSSGKLDKSSDKKLQKGTSSRKLDKGTSSRKLDKGTSSENLDKGTSSRKLDKGTSSRKLDKGASSRKLDEPSDKKKLGKSTSKKKSDSTTSSSSKKIALTLKKSDSTSSSSSKKSNGERKSTKAGGEKPSI